MSKLPWFKFYPGDWFRDSDLQSCGLSAKGLWIQMLCRMFQCNPRGKLSSNGIPWPIHKLANAVGASETDVERALKELVEAGVVRTDDDGALYCNRMMQDEHVRQVNSRNGSRGGRPSKAKQKRNKSEPLSGPLTSDICLLSSVSDTKGDARGKRGTEEKAAAIYSLYPKRTGRKAAIAQILLAMRELSDRGEQDPAAYLHAKTTAYAAAVAKWPEDQKRYVLDPERWFKKGKYDDDQETWQYRATVDADNPDSQAAVDAKIDKLFAEWKP